MNKSIVQHGRYKPGKCVVSRDTKAQNITKITFNLSEQFSLPSTPHRNQPQMNSRLPSFPFSDRQTSSPTFKAESKLNCRTDIKNLKANLLPALA